ncbi:MAG: hypothetical protein DMF30_03635 [Verrucomicrobia bacterium]|nr:MAG: hypothetical protein DMF30_03635 [Verrucomicrobiota bacterium]
MKAITRFTPSLLQNSTITKIPFTIISSLSLNGRFKAIRILVLTGLAAVGLITSMLPAWGARNIRARFQGLGQMPGVVIQPGECGTQAFGISGDGNVIVGAGCVPSSQPGGFVDQAFRWTVTGGYQLLGDLGSGISDAYAASFDGSVVVGSSPPPGAFFGSFRWTATQGMMAVPVGCCPNAVTDDGTMVAGGNAWWKTSGETGNFGDGSCTDPQAPLTMVDLSADGSLAAGSGKGGLDMFGQQATNAYQSTPTGNCQDIDAVFNRNSDASGISADGSTIVGEAQDSQGHYRAFRWTASTGMVDLGTLGGNNLLSNALATNQDGSVVVGTSLTTSSPDSNHAFIWIATRGIQDLQTVLKNHGARIPNGWILQVATDISEDGTVITGYGISPPVQGSNFGQTEPWRAVLPLR